MKKSFVINRITTYKNLKRKQILVKLIQAISILYVFKTLKLLYKGTKKL